ncbi:hypothetical protein GCM10023160_21300 [Brachybacterium paraconglomeratum]|uniref:(deoxy)nucleoside triphosphate pyrophosphohydrolase n=1 Tax=Brachybacterium paraconglomeratum TaxID=173362 RepID=UPI0031E7A83D
MSFEWVRGICPRCGSDQVLHSIIGMPLAEAYHSSPPWVRWEGCTGFGPDRECQSCAYSWWSHDVGLAEGEEEEEDDDDETEDLPPLRVVGAVVVDGDRILAARRAPGKNAAGLWEFPGGKIEAGESPQQALARELREELGVEVEVGWLIGRGEAVVGDRPLHLDCYWVRLRGALPTASTDHDALKWLTRAHLAERDWAEPDEPILELILDGAEPVFSPS